MDPLSEVLSLLKPSSYAAGGFGMNGDLAVRWPRHDGIKCYALLAGTCWLVVEGAGEPVKLHAGDCFILPRGLPFCLTTDLDLEPVDFQIVRAKKRIGGVEKEARGAARFVAGGHFALAGRHARLVLDALPPIVHIRGEADRAEMRWALERMQEELSVPRPGGALISQQLAMMMLVQALRLHLAEGGQRGASWLAALADPPLYGAIAAMHDQPGHAWTLEKLARRAGMSRTVFALRFKEVVGETATEYLTRWRMLLAAERLSAADEPVATIASSLGYRSESSFGKAFRRDRTSAAAVWAGGGAGVAALPGHARRPVARSAMGMHDRQHVNHEARSLADDHVDEQMRKATDGVSTTDVCLAGEQREAPRCLYEMRQTLPHFREESEPEAGGLLLVASRRKVELFLGLRLEAKGGHLPRSLASTRSRTSSAARPVDAPARTREARRSISAPQARASSPADSVGTCPSKPSTTAISSTSAPSGRSVGSSRTSRPFFTWALSGCMVIGLYSRRS